MSLPQRVTNDENHRCPPSVSEWRRMCSMALCYTSPSPCIAISAGGLVLPAEGNFQELKHMLTALPALIQVHVLNLKTENGSSVFPSHVSLRSNNHRIIKWKAVPSLNHDPPQDHEERCPSLLLHTTWHPSWPYLLPAPQTTRKSFSTVT